MSDPSPDASDLPEDVVIARADTDDAERMADCWVDLAEDQQSYGSHLDPAGNRSRMYEIMLQHAVDDTALVARREGSLVGFVTYGRESKHFQQDVNRGFIHNIYVRKGHRSEGIGSELLAAAEAELAILGVDAVALQAMATNDRARRFYTRHGFRPHRIELEKPTESDNLTTDDPQD